jgi:hypothetical protein
MNLTKTKERCGELGRQQITSASSFIMGKSLSTSYNQASRSISNLAGENRPSFVLSDVYICSNGEPFFFC